MEGSRQDEAPATVAHGGDLAWLRARHPDAPEPLIDLSTGINPWPYPVDGVPPAAWTRLPPRADHDAAVGALAAYLGEADPASLVLVPGSEAAIHRLPTLRPPGPVAVVAPTYGAHAPAWAAAGHAVHEVPRDTLARVEAPVVVLANPNNPDGARHDPAELRALARRCRARGGWLVIDEAFADVVPEVSLAAEAAELGAVVLRSFGKAFGLAGVRAGAVAAPPALAAALRAALGAWPVSGPALVLMARAYADAAWIAASRARLAEAAADLDAGLAGAGLDVVGGTPLFRLVETPRAAQVHAVLARHGLAVRRFERYPRWLRFGLPPDAEARARLATALEEAAPR